MARYGQDTLTIAHNDVFSLTHNPESILFQCARGVEVIYTGLHQTPEMIATAAIQEDVDVVGLSVLSGAHMTLFARVRALLAESGRDDILLTGGGIIPKEDMDELHALGIGKLFGPGTPTTPDANAVRIASSLLTATCSRSKALRGSMPISICFTITISFSLGFA